MPPGRGRVSLTPLIKAVADRGYTLAEVGAMTPYQAMLICADPELVEQLCRWRMMTPAVRKIMAQHEGYNGP